MADTSYYKPFASSVPFWRDDAPERLKALLPEILLSIVTYASLSIVMAYIESDYKAAITFEMIAVMVLLQVFLQAVFYTCTYLSNLDIWPSTCIMIVIIIISLLIERSFSYSSPFTGTTLDAYGISISYTILLSCIFFFITRIKEVYILHLALLFMMVAAYNPENYSIAAFAIIVISRSGLFALLIIRASASRVHSSPQAYETPRNEGDGTKSGLLSRLNYTSQVAALALMVGALCLAAGFLSAPYERIGLNVSTSLEVPETAEGMVQADEESSSGMTHVDDHAGQGELFGTSVGTLPSNGERVSGFVTLLLISATIAIAYLTKLLARRFRRCSIEREPLATNRVSTIYLECLSRLEAAGIGRNETETPWEFLHVKQEELENLVAPAGLDLEAWETLTRSFEKAHYGDLPPAESDLETCWRLYDALPSCVLMSVGSVRYFAYSFWHM